MINVLTIIQIVVCIALVGLIVLQAKGTGLGGSSGEFYSSKRGIEKGIFAGTIILAIIFGALSFALLVVK